MYQHMLIKYDWIPSCVHSPPPRTLGKHLGVGGGCGWEFGNLSVAMTKYVNKIPVAMTKLVKNIPLAMTKLYTKEIPSPNRDNNLRKLFTWLQIQ